MSATHAAATMVGKPVETRKTTSYSLCTEEINVYAFPQTAPPMCRANRANAHPALEVRETGFS